MGKKSTLSKPALIFPSCSPEHLPNGFEPSAQTIQYILNYSKALEVEKSNYVEHIEVIRN
jgi:hypothetical protein